MECIITGIFFIHDNASQDGILINNASTTKKIILSLTDVGSDNDDGTGGDMIATVHTDADNAIRIYWKGGSVEGPINFTANNNGDRIYITDCELDGGLVTNNLNLLLTMRIRNCMVKHEGITGGNATQVIAVTGCYSSINGGSIAIFDASDVAGSQTETIVA